MAQDELYSKIVALAQEWNRNEEKMNSSRTQRVVVERHVLGCRCSACWYNFGGAEYAAAQEAQGKTQIASSVYSDIYYGFR